MASIPEPEHSIAAQIDAAHVARNAELPQRPHLGPSSFGSPCERKTWLDFRWAVRPNFSGRTFRIFRRGHNEEEPVVSDLRAIGIDVQATGGDQSRVNFGAHVSGSIDGICRSGVPGAPAKPHILEIKTHNSKSFASLVKAGSVQADKPAHWIQMQAYMHGAGIDRALYVAVCKDDDSIYTERVRYDQEAAEKAVARAQRITMSERMPEPLSADPTWYQCKGCPAHALCHEGAPTKQVNCRTCAHSTPRDDSTWYCERHQAGPIPTEHQRTGCDDHVFHPELVPDWKLDMDASTETVAVWHIKGQIVRNGTADNETFSSRELASNLDACLSDDETIKAFREFGSRVSG